MKDNSRHDRADPGDVVDEAKFAAKVCAALDVFERLEIVPAAKEVTELVGQRVPEM